MSESVQTMDSAAAVEKEGGVRISRRKIILWAVIGTFAVGGLLYLSNLVWADEEAIKATLTQFLEQARGTPSALPIVIAAYILAGLVFFPIILLNLVVAMVFGLWGIVYGLIGIMANTALYYSVGAIARRRGGKEWLERSKFKWADRKLKQIGLAGLVAIHALPAPPFTIMNIIAGISSVSAGAYLLGTFLAMLPGAIARGVVGDSLTKIILNPTPESWLYLAGGILLWVALVGSAHILLNKFAPQEKTAP